MRGAGRKPEPSGASDDCQFTGKMGTASASLESNLFLPGSLYGVGGIGGAAFSAGS